MSKPKSETAKLTIHQPVLSEDVANSLLKTSPLLKTVKNFSVLDCTLGGGGHALEFLRSDENLLLVGIDQDEAAVARVQQRLAKYRDRFMLVSGNFSEIEQLLSNLPGEFVARLPQVQQGVETRVQFHSILVDLGISSDQLKDPARGFSFLHDAQLDMRMDIRRETTASTLLNSLTFAELRRLFFEGGVGSASAALADEVVRQRPLTSTLEFAAICEKILSKGSRNGRNLGRRHHSATVPFQAVRIAVNDELRAIVRLFEAVIGLLTPGGRLGVISFHSLEDKIVTQTMRKLSTPKRLPRGLARILEPQAIGKLLTKKAILPSAIEIASNPASRSARFRVFEKSFHDSGVYDNASFGGEGVG